MPKMCFVKPSRRLSLEERGPLVIVILVGGAVIGLGVIAYFLFA